MEAKGVCLEAPSFLPSRIKHVMSPPQPKSLQRASDWLPPPSGQPSLGQRLCKTSQAHGHSSLTFPCLPPLGK